MKFVFKKPPKAATYCYLVGFSIIVVTMSHQFLGWQWLSVKTNQQIFIAGALIVALGSLFNWIIPLLDNEKNNEEA